jgi:hypothetical protein
VLETFQKISPKSPGLNFAPGSGFGRGIDLRVITRGDFGAAQVQRPFEEIRVDVFCEAEALEAFPELTGADLRFTAADLRLVDSFQSVGLFALCTRPHGQNSVMPWRRLQCRFSLTLFQSVALFSYPNRTSRLARTQRATPKPRQTKSEGVLNSRNRRLEWHNPPPEHSV